MIALGDVRHEGVPIPRVGLDVVGADARFPPFDGGRSQAAILVESVDSDASLVIIGRQEIVSAPVNGDMNRVAAQWNAVELVQVSGFRLNRESGESEITGQTAAHEKETLFGINGHGRGHSGQRVVGVTLQRAG